jgi:serine protease DegQ
MNLSKGKNKIRKLLKIWFFWICLFQLLTIFFLSWLLTTNKGLGGAENKYIQPFRYAAQTALPSVIYLFRPISSSSCNPKTDEAKDGVKPPGQHSNCKILSKDKRNLGSAIIVKSNGVLLTSYHVVKNENNIYAALDDGRNFRATLIGSDPDSDLAFLKIEAENLTALALKSPTDLQVGDIVLAIGNPFSLGKSASMGIVSALNKSHLGINKEESFIQTDVVVNPGESGGALVNLKGELVGINTAIYSQNEAYTGISFAVPVSMAIDVLNKLTQSQKVTK